MTDEEVGLNKSETYYRCNACGYLIHFLQVKYAKINILEQCPRCHMGKFEPYYWKHKESK